jgi:hypothetical protein
MKPVRIVLLVAALLGAAFVAGFFYVVNDDESAIIAGGALFYGRMSDGKVDEAYDTAAAPLREAIEREEMHFLAEDLARFGRFRKIVDITALEHGKAAGWFKASAQFEKQSFPTKLSFVRDGRRWAVTGFEIDFPPEVFPVGDPASVLAAATAFNQAFVADDRLAMYGMLDSSVRRKRPPSQFDKDMAALHGGCGKLQMGAPAMQGSIGNGPVIVDSSVMCETSGRFVLRTSWIWLRTRWRMADLGWTKA